MYKFSDIHPSYAIFDNLENFNYIKKWYERKNSTRFQIKRRTYIKAAIISDFLTSNFVAPNLSTTHITFNNVRCTNYIENIILNQLGFITVELFYNYIQEIINNPPICDEYVETVFAAILSMHNFSQYLRDNHLRIQYDKS